MSEIQDTNKPVDHFTFSPLELIKKKKKTQHLLKPKKGPERHLKLCELQFSMVRTIAQLSDTVLARHYLHLELIFTYSKRTEEQQIVGVSFSCVIALDQLCQCMNLREGEAQKTHILPLCL